MKSEQSTHSTALNLRAATAGLMLAILTILFGQGMGIVFGLNEDVIMSRLKADSAEESLAWLAMPSSGGFVLATVAVLIVFFVWILAGSEQESQS